MKCFYKIIVCIVFLIGIRGIGYSQTLPVKVKAAVDKKEVTIGDKVRYTVSVTADKNIDIEFPDLTKAFADLTVIGSDEKTSSFLNRRTHTLAAVLQTFTPGKYPILKQAIKYKKKSDTAWSTVLTDECSFHVISLLDKTGDRAGLADIKGPLDIRTSVPLIILITVAGLILVVVFWKKIFPGKKPPIVVIQPWKAHETAYAQLDYLRRKGLLEKGLIKLYYSELSGILRHYLENRFSLKAPEMTTEEFIIYMREYSELGREQKDLLKEFLTNCDLVKFARYIPPDSQGTAAFDTAKNFVDQTRSAEAGKDSAVRKG